MLVQRIKTQTVSVVMMMATDILYHPARSGKMHWLAVSYAVDQTMWSPVLVLAV